MSAMMMLAIGCVVLSLAFLALAVRSARQPERQWMPLLQEAIIEHALVDDDEVLVLNVEVIDDIDTRGCA